LPCLDYRKFVLTAARCNSSDNMWRESRKKLTWRSFITALQLLWGSLSLTLRLEKNYYGIKTF
jgi:hypothetical protein